MGIALRSYKYPDDFDSVGRFLAQTYRTDGKHINWLRPRWEYMHYHPLIEQVNLNSIGIWEADGQIVGVVHPEHRPGTAYFQVEPSSPSLKRQMLGYAEEHLRSERDGRRVLRLFINDRDDEFQNVATEKGYTKHTDFEAVSRLLIPDSLPAVSLPSGFRLKSLAEENDIQKINRLYWRGFDHGDEPPEDSAEGVELMQSAPNFRKDLNIVIQAPDGSLVSYCGMWNEPVQRVAYVEPVATDSDYRRRGLASTAVLEGIRRCGECGATVAYVGAVRPLYLSIGFQQLYSCSVWQREWS